MLIKGTYTMLHTENKTYTSIISKLDEAFAKFDEQFRKEEIKFFFDRKKALKEYQATDEARELYKTDAYDYYETLYSIAGGKGMYEIVGCGYYNEAGITEKANKHVDSKIAKRNASISNKLVKAQITNVDSGEVIFSNDGFNGYFEVQTEAGQKRVSIDTIIAGGYNIQRAHYRTLVKVYK